MVEELVGQARAGVATGGAGGQSAPGHPDLVHFDAARDLLVATSLRPEPPTYELFWLHLTGADPALSRDISRALDEGGLSAESVQQLRRAHLGEIAASDVQTILASAQSATGKLAGRLESGRADVAAYDQSIMTEEEVLAGGSLGAADLGGVVERLRRANARMLAANRRLESDIDRVRREAQGLLERLESAERAARTDTLTGLLNRRGLMDSLAAALARAQATGTSLSIALFDIDHFKRINDQWGHAIGDEVLRYLGTFLAHCLRARPESFVGRYGGEEFIAAFPGLSLSSACGAVDAIRAALTRQVVKRASDGARLGRLSFSAGVALARPNDSLEQLVDRADAAVYAAKRAGRDRVLPEFGDAG
jgi:diguanylate cyclase